jgi:nuclease HARBI1
MLTEADALEALSVLEHPYALYYRVGCRNLGRCLRGAQTEEEFALVFARLNSLRRGLFRVYRNVTRLSTPCLEGLRNAIANGMFEQFFRFTESEAVRLAGVLGLGAAQCISGTQESVPGMVCLLVLIFRLARPVQHKAAAVFFGRSETSVCAIYKHTLHLVHDRWRHLLSFGGPGWHHDDHMRQLLQAAQRTELVDVVGFIDGTLVQIARPTIDEELYYTGHKRFHCLRFQAIATLDGLVAYLSPAAPGSTNDAGQMLSLGLYEECERELRLTDETQLYIYGDYAYTTTGCIRSPYYRRQASVAAGRSARRYNALMSSHRVLVENAFGHLGQLFGYFHCSNELRVYQVDPHVMYAVSVLLRNAFVTMRGWPRAQQQYGVFPPSLEQYFTAAP